VQSSGSAQCLSAQQSSPTEGGAVPIEQETRETALPVTLKRTVCDGAGRLGWLGAADPLVSELPFSRPVIGSVCHPTGHRDEPEKGRKVSVVRTGASGFGRLVACLWTGATVGAARGHPWWMAHELKQTPILVRQGLSNGTPLGRAGRGRLKILNEPADGSGYAMVEGGHPVGQPRIRDHVHTRHEESFVVLEGRYEVRVGQDIIVAVSGDYVFIPRGTAHTYRNPGSKPARLLNIISPSDGVQLLSDLGSLAKTKVDETLLAEIHARHGAILVSPLPQW
jgi:mannose-6-phosphate isomerase-like protein (cupin superfamily)